MSTDDIPTYPMPWWVKLIIVLCCLPVLAFPWLLELCPPESAAIPFLWLYIPFTALAAWCAFKVWGRRPELTWVLVFVMILTHIAMWLLVNPAILL